MGLSDSPTRTGKKAARLPWTRILNPSNPGTTGIRVFVNARDRKQIQMADLAKDAVIALLIGCRAPARVLVVETGHRTAALDIVSDTGDLFHDAAKSREHCEGSGAHLKSSRRIRIEELNQ